MPRRRPPDWTAVWRVVHGEQLHLTPAERLLAVQVLTQSGWAAWQIADRLQLSTRSVVRWRAKHRERAAS